MAYLSTQYLTTGPASTTHSDVPSGTFAVHRLTVTDTTPAQVGGIVLVQEGATTEEVIIVAVENGTQFKVEELDETFTSAARVTFLGRTNPTDASGTTTVKNASGFTVYGSRLKQEETHNILAKDMRDTYDWVIKFKKRTFRFEVDNNGTVLETGTLLTSIEPNFAGTITGWRAVADVSGSVSCTLKKNGSSVVASDPIAISASTTGSDASPTGWTTSFNATDDFTLVIDSVSTITHLIVYVDVVMT